MAALGLDEDDDVCEAARSYMTRNGHRKRVVCIAALGELALKAQAFEREPRQEALDRLHEWIDEGRLQTFGMGAGGSMFDTALKLQQVDHMLTPCDAAIIASMIADEAADVLVTMDTFASNHRLIEFARRHEKGFQLLNQDMPQRRRPGGNIRSGKAKVVEERQRARRGERK